jgi:tRNA1Val (adenine37-N6)-methyltransferase
LPDVILTARRMLQSAGRFVVIYTAQRAAELLMQMRANQIEPKVFRSIHARRHSDAKLVLVEGVKGGRPGIQIKSPLILYNEAGDCTPEMARIFEP